MPRNMLVVVLEELTVAQLMKKVPALYGTRSFITVLLRVSYWCLH